LTDSAALLAACDLAIGGDTGPVQLAIAVETPVVALFGSTEPHRTGPYGDAGELIFHRLPCCGCDTSVPCPINYRCMEAITTEEVAAASLRVLARRRAGLQAAASLPDSSWPLR
jgi:ADP-heptose:LPS heptosyltransferase